MAKSPIITDAFTLLKQQTSSRRTIFTFCEKLDQVLGGGIHLGHITELVGPASIGKSQICMQLAVDAHLPKAHSGIQGKVVYIDTECSYKPKRLEEIAKAAVEHVHDVSTTPELQAAAVGFTLDSILTGTFVRQCFDLSSLTKAIEELDPFIQSHPEVKLVIVDSLAFHFRDDQIETHEWRRLLLRTILALAQLAAERNVAIVAVNQMTTRFTDDGDGFDEPALDEILTRNAGDQIILGWKKRKTRRDITGEYMDVDRCAVLYKSSHRPNGLALFRVCAEGVRDLL